MSNGVRDKKEKKPHAQQYYTHSPASVTATEQRLQHAESHSSEKMPTFKTVIRTKVARMLLGLFARSPSHSYRSYCLNGPANETETWLYW